MMQIPVRGGFPAMPDTSGDDLIFRARVITALKDLYMRMEALQAELDAAGVVFGGRAAVEIEDVQDIMGGG